MKLNTNSNVYTIVYATVIVVIVALLLAVVSSALKPKQAQNVELDRKKQVLSSLNIPLKGVDIEKLYEQLIKEQEIEGKQVLVATLEDGSVKFIIPMRGAGLWGPIWGYIALDDDKNTIYGTYFNHESETPGLGGEITTEYFQNRFVGKHILSADNYGVEIVKGETAGEQVQAISGATITSKGVETMINTTLKEYSPFLNTANLTAQQENDDNHNQEEEVQQ
ncbi:MAG: NADH:ubiquinone reductase (Na(+)-transporting) subunit C [Paludibacteraceae bacterium]|nr:NADH:ubiquinone reductase (Na(+)-transporting) subunit C [Paludibacteraceae bacterium]